MKSFAWIIVSSVIVLAAARAHATDADVSQWVSMPPPVHGDFQRAKAGEGYLYSQPGVAYLLANYSRSVWRVFVSQGHVYAKQVDTWEEPPYPDASLPFSVPDEDVFTGHRQAQQLEDGWLVGFDAGEWGGSLWWFSADGTARYKISNGHIRQFVAMGGKLYALEGIGDPASGGKVLNLTREQSGRWVSSTFASLPDAPEVAVLDNDGSMLIVTGSSLIRLTKGKKIEVLLDHAFWEGLPPYSIAVDAGNFVYIGMRLGVARWHIGDRQESVEWTVPNEQFIDAELARFNQIMK